MPTDPNASDRVSAALHELSELLLATSSFQDLMQRIADLSVRTVGGAKTCGITMASDGRVITVAASDELGMHLGRTAVHHRRGPLSAGAT